MKATQHCKRGLESNTLLPTRRTAGYHAKSELHSLRALHEVPKKGISLAVNDSVFCNWFNFDEKVVESPDYWITRLWLDYGSDYGISRTISKRSHG